MNIPEILAPAGGSEQLLAAVRCGADAVYLGSKSFNARRSADNFDEASLAEAVRYCHGRGVAVHVALNTLVTDAERGQLVSEIEQIAQSGADAVIIQDLGVAALVRECCPTLAMHASTQLSVHSVAGAMLMRELGFARLVLARELTRDEIALIKRESGLEIEVFVHGALCMSMSGSCYMSSLIGERSGNRGLCAQPCRLGFVSQGREYVLSLKDLSLIPSIGELAALGVDSLKIEGRMKRPEYVAAAVTACRDALAGGTPDMERLGAVFSRSGFTDGYYTGRRDLSMFGYRRHEDVTAAAGVLGELATLYRGELGRRAVSMSFTARQGRSIELVVSDGVHTVTVQGDPPQVALNRPTDRELVQRGLEKLGGTPFCLGELVTELDDNVMVPMSSLNALRKSAAEQLLTKREATRPHVFTPPTTCRGDHWSSVDCRHKQELSNSLKEGGVCGGNHRSPPLWIRLEHVGQLTTTVSKLADVIIIPIDELYLHRELVARLGTRLVAELPMFIFPDDERRVADMLGELATDGLTAVMAGTQAPLQLAWQSGLRVVGDYSLNILNSVALGAYRAAGLAEATLSFENNLRNAKSINKTCGGAGVLAYGYLPVMSFRNCPVGDCAGCSGVTHVTDRRGVTNPLLCRGKRYTQLLNSVPLYLGDRQEVLHGLDFATLYFTIESSDDVDKLLALWQSGAPYGGQRTGGLYFRELL